MSRTHDMHRLALLIRACARSFMSMFSSTYNITVCASTGKMFITDNGTYTLSCLMSDGTVVYQYRDQAGPAF